MYKEYSMGIVFTQKEWIALSSEQRDTIRSLSQVNAIQAITFEKADDDAVPLTLTATSYNANTYDDDKTRY